jgi:vancomycin resistance protein YoaR
MMDKKIKTPKVKNQVFNQLLKAIPITLMVFLVALVMMLVAFEVVYADRVYPGVSVQNIDLSGNTYEEARDLLSEVLDYTYEGKITITYGDQGWEARPIDLGFLVDPAVSAQQALSVGRDGWLVSNLVEKGQAWFNGKALSPPVYYDERMALIFLQTIASKIDQPMREASLRLENADVVVENGQVGLEVDIAGMLSLLSIPLEYMQDVEIPLIVKETHPEVLDVSSEAELAREMLSEPLVLTDPDGEENEGSWSISPEELAPMLKITRGENGESLESAFQISINEDLFSIYLNGLAPGLQVRPVNARFIFNDETGLLDLKDSAVIGRNLDVQASMDHISETLQNGKHEVSLQFETINPEVTDDTSGESIGITELVHQETSYFYGSDAARVQNIRTASAQFHGLLIPPRTTFSMADALGNISLENGYAEALIIYGDQTIQGVGGGVCQVSTTLFRAAFFAGFPIEERHAHAYRVSYYEQRANGSRDSNLAGLDATVYVPIVDMKFTNDTDYWLLMETYLGNYSLTWKFYSTSDGRTVDWETTGPTEVVPAPEPLYRENPDLEKGEIEQVDYAADGAKIFVNRTVYKDDSVYFSDSFFTQFQPWRAIFEYGPGTEDIPEPGED